MLLGFWACRGRGQVSRGDLIVFYVFFFNRGGFDWFLEGQLTGFKGVGPALRGGICSASGGIWPKLRGI